MIDGELALLVEVHETTALDEDQRLLPAELVPIFCAIDPETADKLEVTAATASARSTWHIAVDRPGAKIAVSTNGSDDRRFVTAAALVPLALATWLDLGERGPAPRDAMVVELSALSNWNELAERIDGMTLTISRPDALSMTVIAPALPTGYYIGVALEGDRHVVMTPATGGEVWLRLSDLLMA